MFSVSELSISGKRVNLKACSRGRSTKDGEGQSWLHTLESNTEVFVEDERVTSCFTLEV